MKKRTSFLLSFLMILATSAVVFYLGFASFRLSPGECAVLVSKITGIEDSPIEFGKFYWSWQLLLPTNAILNKFDTAQKTMTHNIKGELPQDVLYKSQSKDDIDFGYSFDIDVTLLAKPVSFVAWCKQDASFDSDKANKKISYASKQIAQDVSHFLLEKNATYTSEELIAGCNLRQRYSDFDIQNIGVIVNKMPDIELYDKIRSGYLEYQEELKQKLLLKADIAANDMTQNNRSMEKLSRFGELLSLYPQIADLLKDGDISNILKLIDAL